MLDAVVQSEERAHESVLSVVEAVADRSGTSPLDLPPLYDAVDPDRLDRLFTPTDPETTGSALFSYAGYDVTVTAACDVTLSPIE